VPEEDRPDVRDPAVVRQIGGGSRSGNGEGFVWRKVPWVFVVAAGIRLLAVVTFPLSFWIADGKNYMDMLVRGVSNLIHAPGYPFIMGLPWRNPLGRAVIDSWPVAFHYTLTLTQHLVCIAAAYVGYRVARRVFGAAAANLFVVLYLCDYRSIFVTSTVGPEWLQASLGIVLIGVVYGAYESTDTKRKLGAYSLAGLVFAAAYLVKFNSVFLLTCPALIVAADLRRSRRAIAGVGAAALVFVATYSVFLVVYHRPSTGTYSISYDKAWVLLEKARMFVPDRVLLPETGIATKRLIVLNDVLPEVEHRGPIGHIDFVSDEVRAPYREKYLDLFHADHDVLDAYLRSIAIPRPFDFDKAFLPSAYYLDLAESNRLGIAVFREQVAAYWQQYLWDIVRRSARQLIDPNTDLHPTNPMDFREIAVTPLGWGFVRLEIPVREMRDRCFWYDEPVVWVPGAKFFLILSAVQDYPPAWVSILIGVGCWFAIADWRRTESCSPGCSECCHWLSPVWPSWSRRTPSTTFAGRSCTPCSR
jgi:hypothetical protein